MVIVPYSRRGRRGAVARDCHRGLKSKGRGVRCAALSGNTTQRTKNMSHDPTGQTSGGQFESKFKEIIIIFFLLC